jgi:peptidoglycan DL-endopeptidase CwlO
VRTLRSFAVLVLLVLLVDGLVTAAHAGSASVRLSAIATGYAPGCGDSGTTATGRRPGWGTVSVDPRVIPLYSRLYVSGYGRGRALDTGAAIQGARLDLWFSSCSAAVRWGRRRVLVTVYR